MPNVYAMVSNFDKMALWVAYQVLLRADLTMRTHVLKFFLSVANECFELNNHSTAYSIVSGLKQPPVKRLLNTWNVSRIKYIDV